MSLTDDVRVSLKGSDRFFIGGEWVAPSSDAEFEVIDSGTGRAIFREALT